MGTRKRGVAGVAPPAVVNIDEVLDGHVALKVEDYVTDARVVRAAA